jgi:DNA polymerase IV
MGDAMLRWLVLDLNSFFASCEQQENPELRGKPVIVVPTMAETTCAIAASYPAKAFPARSQGQRVLRRCPRVAPCPAARFPPIILRVLDRVGKPAA